MFSLWASSAGNRSKGRGWVHPSKLADRLTKYKNSEGEGLQIAARVTYSEKKGEKKKRHRSSTSQMRACRHPLCCNELWVGWEKYPAWGYLSSFQRFWRLTSEKKATQTHNTFCSRAIFHWATQQSIKSLHKQQPCFMWQHGQSHRFDIQALTCRYQDRASWQFRIWKFLIAYLDSIFLVRDEVYACLHSGIRAFS